MIKVYCAFAARFFRLSAALALIAFVPAQARAQQISPDIYRGLHWRLIGPHRGGRITSVAGVPGQPAVAYMGTPGGGVWKTTDGGQVWSPIFDAEHVSSIGAVAVAPSNSKIIYVGTGEQTQGNGVYRSNDEGATWTNIGLSKTHVITGLIVDPRNPDVLLVAAAGDFASDSDRGIFKTTNGGKDWQRVFFKNDETSVMDISVDAGSPKVMYATTLHRPKTPPDPDKKTKEQDAFIYKSADEGSTWALVGGKGLPAEPWDRTGVAVGSGSHGKTVYAIVAQGFFRSDDGGDNWRQTTKDPRIEGSSYFGRVFVDPHNADLVYLAQTSMYRSTDGGKTFAAWLGAPSGDDYHVIWIDPTNGQNMIVGVDQGAQVSVNGGKTWSSWYNQANGQFYHVSTDNKFPYVIYAAQQDSGTVAVVSRSDNGEITYRDWNMTGAFEFSFIAPDPLDPNYGFAGGEYGSVMRYDRITGHLSYVLVRNARYRTSIMAPLGFSPKDSHTLYAATQYVMETHDGGMHWQEISPDLTLKEKESKVEAARMQDKVTTAMALSTVKQGLIWAGTGNGLLHVTQDGKTWKNVTPPGLPERSAVVAIEASQHDPASAYVVIAAFRDLRPHVFRTHDYGQSWQPITSGMHENAIARIVREDPERKGLLYAGTEDAAYVSFDDGDHWQTLQLNMPTTPVRDLTIHGHDLVAATYGRSLWILDDVSPLRQLNASLAQSDAQLFHPENAVRVRWDVNQDTPLPIETPAGKNPPDGAIINYYLKSAPAGEIKLAIYDSQNNLVREFSSVPARQDDTPVNVPDYWFAPPVALPKTAGINRLAWDLRYPAYKTLNYSYYGPHLDYVELGSADHAVPGETPKVEPQGPYAIPGEYSLVLSVDGKMYRQPLTITPDPRIHVSQADLQSQLNAEKNIAAQMAASYDGFNQIAALRKAIADGQKSLAGKAEAKEALDALKSLDEQAGKIEEGEKKDLGVGTVNREIGRIAVMIGSGDARPAGLLQAGVEQSCEQLTKRLTQWKEFNTQNVPAANTLLTKYKVGPLPVVATVAEGPKCEKQ